MDSRHLAGEEREYTHFRSWEGNPELPASACSIRWMCYSDESECKGHIRDVMHYVLEMVNRAAQLSSPYLFFVQNDRVLI
jgi:hypothetical protein